jgi:dolichyl-phosphate-mannose-protein mannosyltransferase
MMGSRERNLWALAVGVCTSSALSVKWTTLATPGMIAVESFFGFFFLRRNAAPFPDLLKVLAVAAALYYLWFCVHFALLPYTGDGDAFMRVEFQRTLVNNSNYDPLAPHPGYLTTFLQLNQEMLSANARIDQRHNWESTWHEWPLNLRGILYYSHTEDKGPEAGSTGTIYLLGNPAAIWTVAVFLVAAFAFGFLYLRYREHREFQLRRLFGGVFTAVGYCLWAYMLNLLPYILVNRSAFIYHYMPALMYGEVVSALMVDQLFGARKWAPRVIKALVLAILASFLFYAPWVYCYPLTAEGHQRRRLLKRWD